MEKQKETKKTVCLQCGKSLSVMDIMLSRYLVCKECTDKNYRKATGKK